MRKKHRRELANEIYICNQASRGLFRSKRWNFILAITAMAGAVSLARTMTDPLAKQKVLDTVRDHSDGELLNFLHP